MRFKEPATPTPKARERDTQAAILLAFGALPWLRLWRVNVGTAITMDGRGVVRFGIPGMADLTGIVACGRRLEVEVKAEGGRLRREQEVWRDTILRFGGLYHLARSVDDTRAFLDAHLGACSTCRAVSGGTQPPNG